MKKKVSRLLSFVMCLMMVFSVFMGTSQMQAMAEGEPDVKVITQVNLQVMEGAGISVGNVQEGDMPVAIAQIPDGDAGKYTVAEEKWELLKVDTSTGDPVEKGWSSTGSYPDSYIFNTFEDGRSYRYEITLKVVDGSGFTFAENVQLCINGTALDQGLSVSLNGTCVLGASTPFVAGNNGGNGGGQRTYPIEFGTGSWTIGDVTVTANKSGQQTLSESDEITLTNFNADTMEVKLSAADGFNTTLAVTDGKTSLLKKTNDGGIPDGTLTFSVVEKASGGNPGSGPSGGGDNPPTNPETIAVNITAGSDYLGSRDENSIKVDGVAVKNGSVTVEQADTHVISIQPEFGYAISAKINGTEVTGTELDPGWISYTVADASSYDIAISQAGSSVCTVAWDYVGNFGADALVSNGTVKIVSAVMPDGSNGIDIINEQNADGGHVAIKPGSTVTVEIKPDYGYQFLEGSLNEQKIVAGAEVSKFTFTMPETNLHLSALFTKTDDIINTDSKQVSSATVGNGAAVVDSGNLKLEIGDLTEEQKAAVDANMKEKAGDDEIQLYLDMDLYNVVNKGTQNDAWENKLTELDGELSITLQLSDELKGKDGTFYVIREHDEADGTKSYTKIQAEYNKEAGTITFKTNKFSTYALVMENAQKNNDKPNGEKPNGGTPDGEKPNGGTPNGEKPTGGTTTGDGAKTESPKTGDTNAVFGWFMLAIVCGAGTLYFGKKRIA